MAEVEQLPEFTCIERHLDPEEEQEALQVAVEENPWNGMYTSGPFGSVTPVELSSDPARPSALVVNVSKYWAAGRTLNVKFLSGDATLRQTVRQIAETWKLYANLNFNWLTDDSTAKAHIRIDFTRGNGHWSYVGTDNLGIPQNQKTMNLDVARASRTEIRRVTLHEFGHAIGCEHEHQSPSATFQWNKEVVYRELGGPPNKWSRETVDHNVINRLNSQEVAATAFDASSIMCYAFPARWFMPGTGSATNNNTALSARDKDFIGTVYPPNYSDVGLFNTMQVRAWDAMGNGRDSITVPFTPVYPEPPRMALGLNWVDIDAGNDITVRAVAEEVAKDNFTVAVISTLPTRLYSAGLAWLEVAAKEADLVIGTVDFTSAETKTINFASRFDSDESPTVVAFLTGFDLGKNAPWKLKTFVTEASPFKFKLHLETAAGVDLRSATVTWVAFPKTKEEIVAGVLSTDDIPGLLNPGTVDFARDSSGSSPFENAPQLFAAISGLDFENGRNLRLRLGTSVVTPAGFSWNFDSWWDSLMNSATAAYIAISPSKAANA